MNITQIARVKKKEPCLPSPSREDATNVNGLNIRQWIAEVIAIMDCEH